MSTITEAFINALLADASYVRELQPNLPSGTLRGLLAGRMTPTLAEFIANNFTVASAINSSDNPLDGSGFDAVVWRGRPNGLFPGTAYVSMLCAEPWLGADLFVADVAAANTRRRAERGDGRWWATPSSTPRASQTRRSRSARC